MDYLLLYEGLKKEIPDHLMYLFYIWKFLINDFLGKNRKSGVGIKICPRVTTLPCLLFEDDCLLFYKISHDSCTKLKNILNSFCINSR